MDDLERVVLPSVQFKTPEEWNHIVRQEQAETEARWQALVARGGKPTDAEIQSYPLFCKMMESKITERAKAWAAQRRMQLVLGDKAPHECGMSCYEARGVSHFQWPDGDGSIWRGAPDPPCPHALGPKCKYIAIEDEPKAKKPRKKVKWT